MVNKIYAGNSSFSSIEEMHRMLIPLSKILKKFNIHKTNVLRKRNNSIYIEGIKVEILPPREYAILTRKENVLARTNAYCSWKPKTIVIKNNGLINVISSLGHELGHLGTRCIKDDISEEAKAYAFEFAWAIEFDKNISFKNGGNVIAVASIPPIRKRYPKDYFAHQFVMTRINEGESPLRLYDKIALGRYDVGEIYETEREEN